MIVAVTLTIALDSLMVRQALAEPSTLNTAAD